MLPRLIDRFVILKNISSDWLSGSFRSVYHAILYALSSYHRCGCCISTSRIEDPWCFAADSPHTYKFDHHILQGTVQLSASVPCLPLRAREQKFCDQHLHTSTNILNPCGPATEHFPVMHWCSQATSPSVIFLSAKLPMQSVVTKYFATFISKKHCCPISLGVYLCVDCSTSHWLR